MIQHQICAVLAEHSIIEWEINKRSEIAVGNHSQAAHTTLVEDIREGDQTILGENSNTAQHKKEKETTRNNTRHGGV